MVFCREGLWACLTPRVPAGILVNGSVSILVNVAINVVTNVAMNVSVRVSVRVSANVYL